LWDQATGGAIATLREGGTPVHYLYFANDRITYVDAFGVATDIELEVGALLERARTLVPENRPLTPTECLTYFGVPDCG